MNPRPADHSKVCAYDRRSYHNICPTTHQPFYLCTVAAASHSTLLIVMENLPAASYPSLEEAFQAVKAFAKKNSYAVNRSMYKTNKAGTEVRKIWMKCAYGLAPKSRGSGLRRTSSCDSGNYVWRIKIIIGEHTGDNALEDPAAYATNRFLQPEQELQVTTMVKAGATPHVILATLRQDDPTTLLIGKDIYNTKQNVSRFDSIHFLKNRGYPQPLHLLGLIMQYFFSRQETVHRMGVDLSMLCLIVLKRQMFTTSFAKMRVPTYHVCFSPQSQPYPYRQYSQQTQCVE
ncbi:hypothetical protein PsorP6_000046 [Peronosclerospora sorghi]|uniref:Uncharacterized protein n=1 Tax=Peronosclerospora sorghi TaxID=230839 RepID=A0ACC0WRV0_9STRA|nr:hypothetical protein PsorP6_000046 [Peronosclerospora sorghi]